MNNYISAEMIKLKRRKILLLPIIFLIINIVYFIMNYHNLKSHIFSVYLKSYSLVFFISVILISAFAFYLIDIDFRNDIFKQIFTTSITSCEYVLTKFTLLFAMSEILMIIYALTICIGSFIMQIPFSKLDIIFIILLSFLDGFLIFIALLPIYTIVICLIKNVIIIFLAIFAYPSLLIFASVGIIKIDFLQNTHPLMSIALIHNEIAYNYIPVEKYGIIIETKPNILINIFNIAILALISIFTVKVYFNKLRQ